MWTGAMPCGLQPVFAIIGVLIMQVGVGAVMLLQLPKPLQLLCPVRLCARSYGHYNRLNGFRLLILHAFDQMFLYTS